MQKCFGVPVALQAGGHAAGVTSCGQATETNRMQHTQRCTGCLLQVLHMCTVYAPNLDTAFVVSVAWTALQITTCSFIIPYTLVSQSARLLAQMHGVIHDVAWHAIDAVHHTMGWWHNFL